MFDVIGNVLPSQEIISYSQVTEIRMSLDFRSRYVPSKYVKNNDKISINDLLKNFH